MVEAIRTGDLGLDLACMKPGTICHSRWLTTANTFCQMWVSKHGLEGELYTRLQDIVIFIVQCYYPTWFQVNHSWIEGPKNILYEFSCLRTQKESLIALIEKVVRTSLWFAHSESVVMTMLCSTDAAERSWAVDKILAIRGEEQLGDKSVRSRDKPLLNQDPECIDRKEIHCLPPYM